MEDAAALAVVLPQGTKPEDVPQRLKLYFDFRYERCTKIQRFSQQAGRDIQDEPLDSKKLRLVLTVAMLTLSFSERQLDLQLQSR